jgi:Big-like domain-containing protein
LTTRDALTAHGGRLAPAVGLVCATLLLAFAAPASAQWRPVVRSCASDGAATGCSATGSFSGAWNVAVSPDGKHAYGAAWNSGSIHIFDRNSATGALTWKACVINGGPAGGCGGPAQGIALADSIVFSANGLNVYVTGWFATNAPPNPPTPSAIATFTRDPGTGLLTFAGCHNDSGVGCTAAATVGGHNAVMSSDQKSIYVTGNNSLSAWSRNLVNGALTPLGCFGAAAGCTALPAGTPAPGGRQLAISPNGIHLYVPAALPQGGVLVFERDPGTGGISLLPGGQGCITRLATATCSARAQLSDFTPSVLMSPNGAQVYVTHTNGVVVFARAANGRLTYQSCVNDTGNLGCSNGYNVAGIYYGAFSPDGQDLVAVHGGGAGGISTLARAANGNLVTRSGLDSCITIDGNSFDNGMLRGNACRVSAAVSAQGGVTFYGNQHFYAGGWPQGRIGAFKRDFLPVCTSRNVTVPRNTAQTIPLTCSDRNGDPVARSIIAPPAAGTLGAINQGAGTVFYDPFSNFAGTDRFTFRATAAGLTSAPAAINITVPGPPPRPLRRIRVGVSFSYDAYSDRTVLKKLQIKGVPPGSRVRAVCANRGRKCGGKARKAFLKNRARGRVSLASRYVGVDIPIGARITVTVTRANRIGAVKILTMRPRKEPSVTSRCLPPGARRPQRC